MTTRESILDAAARLFGEVGFEGTSTRRIGELSGINKALIHYHFTDKEDLWNQVIARYYERLGRALRPIAERAGPVPERLVELAATYLDFLAENRAFACMVQREISGGRHVRSITAQMVPLFEIGKALLHDAYPATRRGPLEAAELLVSFYGMAVSWLTYGPVSEGMTGIEPASPRALALRKAHLARMIELVSRALEAPDLVEHPTPSTGPRTSVARKPRPKRRRP